MCRPLSSFYLPFLFKTILTLFMSFSLITLLTWLLEANVWHIPIEMFFKYNLHFQTDVLHFETETTDTAERDLEKAVSFLVNVPQLPDAGWHLDYYSFIITFKINL